MVIKQITIAKDKDQNIKAGLKSRLKSLLLKLKNIKIKLSRYINRWYFKIKPYFDRLNNKLPPKIRSFKYKKELSIGFLILIVGLITFLVFRIPPDIKTNLTDVEKTSEDSNVITFSTNTPDETPINDWEHFTLPDDPRLLNLPTINTLAYIQNVGVDQNNEIAVPNNIHLAGWYVNSIKPGRKGLSIIDGHVDGLAANGIFYNLKNLNKEDTFTVEYGDGSKYDFKVVDIVEVDVNNAANILFSKRREITNQLNLITCIGTFNTDVQSYDKRLIVISELISDNK